MYLCLCKGVTEREVDRCVEAGHCTADALIAALGLDDPSACGRCEREIGQCGPAAWRVAEVESGGASAHGLSLIDMAVAATRRLAAPEPLSAIGLPSR